MEQPILSLLSDAVGNHLRLNQNVDVPFITELPLGLRSSYTDGNGSVLYFLEEQIASLSNPKAILMHIRFVSIHLACSSSATTSGLEHRTFEVQALRLGIVMGPPGPTCDGKSGMGLGTVPVPDNFPNGELGMGASRPRFCCPIHPVPSEP